jgi:predicted NBD/HSP70 family sugar kinase
MNPIWGIDLGGTKIEGIVLDSDTGKVIDRKRVPTESKKGYDHILNQIESLITSLSKESGLTPTRIGIGTPGTEDPTSLEMKNCNATVLNGKKMRLDLEKRNGIPFKIANDANCFAIAETLMGVVPSELPDAKVVFGVILGTGVGGGLVVNGKVISGRHGIGGEWGHNFLDHSGAPCYCGRSGCVETILAGPSIERYYKEISGKSLGLKDIVTAYRSGNDTFANQTMERFFNFFGKAMGVIINIVDPDAIIIGGGVGNIEEIYTIGVEKIKPYIFNKSLETKILKPKLGDSAGVFGAAFL